jgi:N-acyl-D-aspartate/D-glutamate deacylase
VIVNARIADGTGKPLLKENLQFANGKIEKLGKFKPRAGEQVIDGRGLVWDSGTVTGARPGQIVTK